MAILDADKEAKLLAEYKNWIEVAKKGRPKPHTDQELPEDPAQRKAMMAARAAEIAAYDTNPGAAIYNKARADIIASGYRVDPVTGEFTGASANTAQRELDDLLIKREAEFAAGLKVGAQDQSHFNKAMEALFQFPPQILTAIKQLFMSIPIVGDVMAAGGKMMMSLFSGKPLGPMAAYDMIKQERALAGGLERLGIKDKPTVDRFTAIALDGTVKPPVVPVLVLGKTNTLNAPEIAAEMAKIQAIPPDTLTVPQSVAGKKFNSVVVIQGADGKKITVMGSQTGKQFTVLKVLKPSDNGDKLVPVDAKSADGNLMSGQTFTIETNGQLSETAKSIIVTSASIETKDGKAYGFDKPEVTFVATDANVKAEIDKIVDKSKASIITLKDENGQPIVLVGTQEGDKFTVAAVMKRSPDGKTFIPADVKKADGTGPLVGETITLEGGAMKAEDASRVKEQVNVIDKGEVKPGKVYTATSEERDLAAVRDKLLEAKLEPKPYEQFMTQGKVLMVMQDSKDNNKQVIVMGSMNGNKFKPEAILKDVNGVLTKVDADITKSGKELDLDSKGTLTSQSFAILQASVDIKYRGDGKQDIDKLTPALDDAVRKYATLRFTNLETGDVDEANKAKIDEFVKRYTTMVVNSGMSPADQDARANVILARITDAKTKLGIAKIAAEDAEKKGATPANPDDEKYSTMKVSIQAAMDILTGKTKPDTGFDESVKQIEADALLKAPTTPKTATSAGLKTAAGLK